MPFKNKEAGICKIYSNKRQKTITYVGTVGGNIGDDIIDIIPCKTCAAFPKPGGSSNEKHDRSSPSCKLFDGSKQIPESEKKRLHQEKELQKENNTLEWTTADIDPSIDWVKKN